MHDFTRNAVAIIKQIPCGKVMTYGQVATAAGSSRAARQVVRILHSMSEKHNLPWHRVINAKGEIGFKDGEKFHVQKKLLQNEGITFKDSKSVDLHAYTYQHCMIENVDDLL